MANDLNLCQFIGRLGNDPEMRYTADGKAIANLSIACGQAWKDKSGNKQEKTEWVRVSAFGRLAEIIGEYLSKGSQVYISGRLQTRKWQDQDGQDRYTTEIVASDMQMLGGKNQQNTQQNAQQSHQPRQQQQQQQQQQQAMMDDLDDDIPF